jgi:hypothetical protein
MENHFEKYKNIYLNFLFKVECYKAGEEPEDVLKELSKSSIVNDEELQRLEQKRLKQLEKERLEEEQREAELIRLAEDENERQRREEEERIKREEEINNKSQYDLDFPDGYYMGETLNGLMHGKGIRYWNNGKKWEGTWENGKANGQMIVTFDGELVYEGNMVDDLPHGKGKYFNPDTKETYDGDWLNFKREGMGTLLSESGEKIYEGEWKNDKYHGYGQYFLRGICRYEGAWEIGKRNGEGSAYDENGNVEYKGQFVDDVRVDEPDRIEQAAKENEN